MHELEFEKSISIGSLIALKPESERALIEAASDLTKSRRYPDEKLPSEPVQGKHLPWNRPIPLIEQVNILEYRIEELEYLLRRKEQQLNDVIESLPMSVARNPHQKVETFSLVGIIVFAFTIALYVFCGVLIVNPIFSAFAIVACVMFWLMSKADSYTSQNRQI